MAKYEETFYIAESEFIRINKLLAIESLEELTDEELIKMGANTDYCEGVFSVKFDNGAVINFDLCSGQNNYYDDVTWISADDTRVISLDCKYELGDIEVEIDSETYIVHVITVQDEESVCKESICLTDITGTIGMWLGVWFDEEVPFEVINLLNQAYALAAKELDK